MIRQLAERGIRTKLGWIPAYQGILGNEVVDKYTKEATQGPDKPQNPHNRYIRLVAATKRRLRNEANIEWERA